VHSFRQSAWRFSTTHNIAVVASESEYLFS
jgi:hypothetical protein